MSMINCPKCGEKFDDNIGTCPKCGFEIEKENSNDFKSEQGDTIIPGNQKDIVCKDCGNTFSAEMETCPFCGCRVSNTIEADSENASQEIKSDSKKIKIDEKKRNIIIAIVAVVVIIIAIVSIFCYKSYSDRKAYEFNLENACDNMFVGAQKAEEAGGLIHDVWYNCIFEKRDKDTDKYTRTNSGTGIFYNDFNYALKNLYSDVTFRIDIASIEENVELVDSSMRKLKDPPEEFEEAYDAIKELYNAYNELTEIVISPSGNLTTFTNNFNSADSDFIKYYKAMKMYVDLDY